MLRSSKLVALSRGHINSKLKLERILEVRSYDEFEFEAHNSNGLWQVGVTMI